MDINEELTLELKADHWRIARLMVDNGARMRLAAGEAPMVVAKVLLGAWMKDPRVVDAQSIGPPRAQLQVKASASDDVVTQEEGTGEEGIDR